MLETGLLTPGKGSRLQGVRAWLLDPGLQLALCSRVVTGRVTGEGDSEIRLPAGLSSMWKVPFPFLESPLGKSHHALSSPPLTLVSFPPMGKTSIFIC